MSYAAFEDNQYLGDDNASTIVWLSLNDTKTCDAIQNNAHFLKNNGFFANMSSKPVATLNQSATIVGGTTVKVSCVVAND